MYINSTVDTEPPQLLSISIGNATIDGNVTIYLHMSDNMAGVVSTANFIFSAATNSSNLITPTGFSCPLINGNIYLLYLYEF